MTFRVRALSSTGDYQFGKGGLNFLVDSPAAVAQCVGTRLKLWEGEWFLDLADGTPWFQSILQHKNIALAEEVLRQRILGTPFVVNLDEIAVSFNEQTRAFVMFGRVATAFGIFYFRYPVNPAFAGPFTIGVTPLGGGGLG